MKKIVFFLMIATITCSLLKVNAETENLIKGEGSDFWSINFYGGSKKGSGSFSILENNEKFPCVNISGFEQKVTGQAISRKISVTPGEKLKFNFEVKSNKNKAVVQLRFLSKNNKHTGKYVVHIKMISNIWTEAIKAKPLALYFGANDKGQIAKRVTKSFRNPAFLEVPPKSVSVRIFLFHSGVGSTMYKNISLINLSPKVAVSQKKANPKNIDKALEAESKRLLMDTPQKDKKITPYRGKKLELVIKDVELPFDYKMTSEKFPKSATNIRVKDGNFTRNDKPVFLFGLESSAEVFPWKYRAMGIDFIHMGDIYVMSSMRYKKKGEKLHIWWEPYKWMETQIRLLLKNGIAVYVQPIEGGTIYKRRSFISKELDKHGALTNTCHFVGFRPDSKLGVRLRNNFWKSVLQITRKYPIFIYELYNEMRYTDYSPENLKLFREAMRNKYKTIAFANKTWGTSFQNFVTVMPPVKGASYGNAEYQITPKNFSRMLWRDWGVFIEKRLGQHLLDFKSFIKKYEKSPYSYLTTQSFFDMPESYVSLGGGYPEEVMKSEDVFGMELGGTYREQFDQEENPYEIKQMLKFSFIRNTIGNISSKKPIMGEECCISKADKLSVPGKFLIKLHGEWKFKADNDKKGLDRKYEQKNFNDSDWAKISVPGMWGRQGFKECKTGWYRKEFFVSKNLKGRQIYINAKELADKALIYLNGKLLKQTKKWSEAFSINLEKLLKYGEKNTLAIRISCSYKSSGFYWGGIRNLISINKTAFFTTPKVTEGEMRDWLWNQMFNGFSGLFMSYAYTSDNKSILSPKYKEYRAIRAIPKIKNEINSLGEIILPRPRLKAKTAMLYPFETGRAHIYKKHGNWMKAPLLSDIMDFYCPTLFKQLDIDVINNDILLRKGLDKYQMFIMAGCKRVQKGTIKKLDKFVKNGGVLIVNHDSLKIEDIFNTAISTPDFWGVKPGVSLDKTQTVSLKGLGLEKSKTVKSKFAGSFGVELVPRGAKILAVYANGKAAITVNNYGKGKVYYIGCELDFAATSKVIGKIIDANKIEKTLDISSNKPAKFLEAHVLGRNGKYVWYIFNWGGGKRNLNVARKNIPDGNYRIIDIVKGTVISSSVSAKKIRKGIAVSIKSHDPVILLVENTKLKPTKLKKLSRKEQKFINLWRPSPKGEIKVLLGSAGSIMSKSRMLTAVNMLEQFGFEFSLGMTELNNEMETFNETSKLENISNYQIVTFMGNSMSVIRHPKKVQKVLDEYVKKGGSLLLAANFYVGPHSWQSNNRIASLPKTFGINYTNTNIRDEKEHGFVPEFPTFTDIASDEITKGVKVFQSRGMSMLKVKNPNAKILVKAGKNSSRPGAPVMIALEYGKGRVVIMGDARWMKPDQLDKGDNAQLMLNIFNWLAHRPFKIQSKAQIQRLIDTKF